MGQIAKAEGLSRRPKPPTATYVRGQSRFRDYDLGFVHIAIMHLPKLKTADGDDDQRYTANLHHRRVLSGKKAQETMIPDCFATRSLRAQDQFETWREWFAPTFDVVPKQPTCDEFPAAVHLWKLSGLAVSRTSAPPLHVVRSNRHLRQDPVDHWIISYCVRGAHSARTAGIEVEVPARVPYLWSLGQEFLHERTHVARVQLIMTRDSFRDIAPLLDAACGTTLDTPLGHLLGDYMIALERRVRAVTDTDLPGITKAVGAMVAAAVAPSPERVRVANQQIDLGRKERVRQTVRRHLRTPTLGPKNLGRLVGMSRSNLYRLFEETRGVARYIQRERLLEARAILSDPEETQSISSIAEDLCFADGSSFARTFRREFGYSPREARDAALSGLEPGGTPKKRGPSAAAHFGELLRRF